MSYKCGKCKRYVGSGIPQSKIYDKIRLVKGNKIVGELGVCFNCAQNKQNMSRVKNE